MSVVQFVIAYTGEMQVINAVGLASTKLQLMVMSFCDPQFLSSHL